MVFSAELRAAVFLTSSSLKVRFSLLFLSLSFISMPMQAVVGSVLIFPFFSFTFGFAGGLVCPSMVSSSEVRTACPSVSFLFTRLGGSLGVFPHLENFISEGNSLGVVVADLLPLLC